MKLLLQIIVSMITAIALTMALNAAYQGLWLLSIIVVAFASYSYSWLAWIPASRATAEATAPGSIAAATIRSFSARDHRRRRSTDVITSTCVLVIGLALGLA